MRIPLPLSKSIAARRLLLAAVHNQKCEVEEENDDIKAISAALKSFDFTDIISAQSSATALKFLISFAALRGAPKTITASEQLKARPIDEIVCALRGLGAEVAYLEREGAAPVRVVKGIEHGGALIVDASRSSQHISALMIVATALQGGLQLTLQREAVSKPYIELTKHEIERAGGRVDVEDQNIKVHEIVKNAINTPFFATKIENDWSSALFFFAWVACTKKGQYEFDCLPLNSAQPDAATARYFMQMGVNVVENGTTTIFYDEGCDCLAHDAICRLDMSQTPDSAMLLAATFCILGVRFELAGLRHLRYKESNRLEAMVDILNRSGYCVESDESTLAWRGGRKMVDSHIDTRCDHRLTMMALLLAGKEGAEINDVSNLAKSFPQLLSYVQEENGRVKLNV